MHLSKLLYYEGVCKLGFEQKPLKGLEIWVFKDHTPVVRHETVQPDDLELWLHQDGKFKVPQQVLDHKVIGGLRLLVHRWKRPSTGQESGVFTLPFDRKSFAKVVGAFLLPRSIASDFASEAYVPARLENVRTNMSTDRIGIVCQSPYHFNIFTSIALSYDPETRTTSGLVRLMSHGSAADDHISNLIPQLKASAEKAFHPLLLPSLSLGMWQNILQTQQDRVHNTLTGIQYSTGLMRGYLHDVRQDPGANTPAQDYGTVHAQIVTQHAFLTTALSNFVKAFGIELHRAFDATHRDENSESSQISDVHSDLILFVSYLRSKIATELEHREILLGKVQMQLQVVYNLMQQRDTHINQKIAIEAKRDSSAMKSLALITVVFLPMTAIATLFSIQAFFASNRSGDRLQVTQDFWVFWAVVGPFTILMLICWAAWINREKFLSNKSTTLRRRGVIHDEESGLRRTKFHEAKDDENDAAARKSRGLSRERTLSEAEIQKWGTLQSILKENPADPTARAYYGLPIPQSENPISVQPPSTTSISTILGLPSTTHPHTTTSTPPTTTAVASLPDRETHLHFDLDAEIEDDTGEYADLVRYIITHNNPSYLRGGSGAVEFGDDPGERSRSKGRWWRIR